MRVFLWVEKVGLLFFKDLDPTSRTSLNNDLNVCIGYKRQLFQRNYFHGGITGNSFGLVKHIQRNNKYEYYIPYLNSRTLLPSKMLPRPN